MQEWHCRYIVCRHMFFIAKDYIVILIIQKPPAIVRDTGIFPDVIASDFVPASILPADPFVPGDGNPTRS